MITNGNITEIESRAALACSKGWSRDRPQIGDQFTGEAEKSCSKNWIVMKLHNCTYLLKLNTNTYNDQIYGL